MMIIIFINVFSSEIRLKGLIVMGTIFLYFVFSGYIKPNKSDSINSLDVHISQVTGFTILIGLFIYENPYDFYVILGFFLIISTNLLVFLELIQSLIKSLTQRFDQILIVL